MRRQLAVLASCAFVATSGAVLAHHSFAMFDQENPIELEGVVQEFKFTSPHSFIILQVRQQDGGTQLWSLEGGAPSALVRDGWSSKTLKPGDELQLTVEPLRSGAPGGSWSGCRRRVGTPRRSPYSPRETRSASSPCSPTTTSGRSWRPSFARTASPSTTSEGPRDLPGLVLED